MKIKLTDDRAKEYSELCNDVLDDIENLPDRAADFAISCDEKIRGILTTIEKTGRVTDKQAAAIENIQSGVSRWLN